MSSASNIVPFPRVEAEGFEGVVERAPRSHVVRFYEEERELVESVAHYLADGFHAGERLLVIATAAHRDAFARRLHELLPPRAIDGDRLIAIDAHDMLAAFMVDGVPDRDRFFAAIAPLLSPRGPAPRLRAYGEMVDVLWREGSSEAALRLEDLWNEAAERHAFSLYCAYAMAGFYKEPRGARFFHVCSQHTAVLGLDASARVRELEIEIAKRQELEDELRGALRRAHVAEDRLKASLARETVARGEAEAAIAFREMFAGMLGHDLRSPLTTILATARLMQNRREVVAGAEPRMERIIASGVRMQRMIEQLLDMTRARLGGGLTLRRSFDDAAPRVSAIVDEARAAHPGRPIELRCEGDAWLTFDADRFERVASNLLCNALAHGDAARPVTVTLRGRESEVVLRVHNFGAPIPPEVLPLLFDPFRRIERGSDAPIESRDGLGLGLYITEQIVAAHGGSIRVDSTAERGTSFEVSLPKHGGASRAR